MALREYPTLSLRSTSQQAQLKTLTGLVASKSKWQKWINTSLDLLFPPRCVGCDRVDFNWCPDCQETLQQYAIEPQTKQLAQQFKVVSTGKHAGLLAQSIHAFKYQNSPHLYRPLSERLAACRGQWGIVPDLLVPVPLHPKREQERGYNQSALLVAGVSQLTGIPYRVNLLKRHVATKAQVGLSQEERLLNMKAVFSAESVNDLKILLIDDVTTTGATLYQCALTLKQAGASQIYGLTVTST